MRKLIIIFVLFACATDIHGQSLMGTTGWLNIPSADMQEDGTFYIGTSFVNKNYVEDYGGGDNNVLTYYFDVTFLPFLEVNFANTRLLDYQGDHYTVDRRFSFRFRPLREHKYIPAIVIGAHDVYTSIDNKAETNQYFGSLYIVATKHIPVKKSEFGITLGYGFKAFRVNQFIGFFGGVSFSPAFLRQLNFIGEYDGKNINLGANILFFKHLFVYAMVSDIKYFSGGIAYHIYLLNTIKKKHKDRKKKQ